VVLGGFCSEDISAMVKDRHSPPNETDDHADAVTIMSPDGTVQQRFTASRDDGSSAPEAAEKSRDASKKAASQIAAGAVPRDASPALNKRLDAEAATTTDEQADDLAEAIYAKFMTLLTDSITEKGGNLTLDDVDEMGETFKAQMGDIKETFLNAVETYTQAREKNRVSSERGSVYHRIMIHPFEHRLASEKDLNENPDHLSRRMLPGFYNVMSMMFGPPKLARYEEKTKLAIDRLLKESNGRIEWEDVYLTPEIRRISLRSQIDVARHFKDIEKRLDWMVAMVNSNTIPLEDGKSSSGWTFTRETAEILLNDLFHDLRSALKNPSTRQRFTTELGGETMDILDAVTKRFS
jgi:hypothetical protein